MRILIYIYAIGIAGMIGRKTCSRAWKQSFKHGGQIRKRKTETKPSGFSLCSDSCVTRAGRVRIALTESRNIGTNWIDGS